jgi:hypothetical protein
VEDAPAGAVCRAVAGGCRACSLRASCRRKGLSCLGFRVAACFFCRQARHNGLIFLAGRGRRAPCILPPATFHRLAPRLFASSLLHAPPTLATPHCPPAPSPVSRPQAPALRLRGKDAERAWGASRERGYGGDGTGTAAPPPAGVGCAQPTGRTRRDPPQAAARPGRDRGEEMDCRVCQSTLA